LRGERAQLLASVFGEDFHMGAGRRQEFRFPRHRRSIAGDDRALPVEIEEERQPREGLHAGRARLLRMALDLDQGHQYTSC